LLINTNQVSTQTGSIFSNISDSSVISKDEEEVIKQLKEMGVDVFYKNKKGKYSSMSWDQLGGYEKQKRDIEDTILMALKYSGNKMFYSQRIIFNKKY
jgi:hypothetical protein